MIEYVLGTDVWTDGDPWYYGRQIEREVLGFGSSGDIVRSPAHASLVDSMRDLYRKWAQSRLHGDEDNLAGFAAFLSTDAGRVLRLDGLHWIAAALKKRPDAGQWHRDSTTGAFIAFLNVMITDHAGEISNGTAREAMIQLVALAVGRHIKPALALQERLRRLL